VRGVPLVIGLLLALVVSLLAWAAGFDRDRSFYPTVLCVVASYYVLFAVMGGSMPVLVAELWEALGGRVLTLPPRAHEAT
jgi:multidrug transporter EmrE-like cation transporter